MEETDGLIIGETRAASLWRRQKVVIIALVAVVIAAAIVIAVAITLAVVLTSDSGSSNSPPSGNAFPLVIATWNFPGATDQAWVELIKSNTTAVDAIEKGCNYCEDNPQNCGYSVGFGGNPNELGETTLDAMIMWAPTMEVGSVGCLRRIKNAISVARKVMEETYHTLLVGEDATTFAFGQGFPEQNLTTNRSAELWQDWVANGRVPNHWKNPHNYSSPPEITEENHDTIGMVAIDQQGHVSCGVTTNGLLFKIPGRVGDSPVVGAGCYCDDDVGGAAGTGNGDVMMRFAPTRMIVYLMKTGQSPSQAVATVLAEMMRFYPTTSAAFIAVNKQGVFGAGYIGRDNFPYVTRTPAVNGTVLNYA